MITQKPYEPSADELALLRPMEQAPRGDVLIPVMIRIQFRGDAELAPGYWSDTHQGWVDERDERRPLIRDDAIGWLPEE
jgi:hypothetical protein